jgi:predicted TIM-barrel fold metal-dependent hydrolase
VRLTPCLIRPARPKVALPLRMTLSRRKVLAAALAAGAARLFPPEDVVHAVASQPRTKLRFAMPPGATDCATHIYNDPKRHPFWEGRTYTPEPATVTELKQMMGAVGFDRVVVVQASTYGTDNAIVIDSIRELGPGARGVAMIDDKTTEAALDAMHRGGVRGIRLMLGNLGATDPAAARLRLSAASERMKKRTGWSVLISGSPETWVALRRDFEALGVPIVVDHFGEPRVPDGVGQPGFQAVLGLVKSGKAYVKLSNADTLTNRSDMSDITPYATALIAANAQRVVWGTAWPHPSAGAVAGRKPTDVAIHRDVDDARTLNMLPTWAPDAATRKMILVDNPARLYSF